MKLQYVRHKAQQMRRLMANGGCLPATVLQSAVYTVLPTFRYSFRGTGLKALKGLKRQ